MKKIITNKIPTPSLWEGRGGVIKKEKITMKKTYSNPTLKVVKIQTSSILVGSAPKLRGTTTQTSGNLGRGASFSDDDWDE